MAKVVVFHGTTIERARKIIKDKKIRPTTADIARYGDTTKGYVYVTKRLCDALEFSTKPILGESTKVFVVFKAFVEESELLPDADEKKWVSTLTDDGWQDCFRIQRELCFDKDEIAVFCKEMKSHDAVGNYMQAIQYGETKVKESEWRTLWQD